MAAKGEMLSKMISLATERHAGQFDKGGRPYILHPLTVMHRLRTDDEELQCIAVGHDLIEDTSTTATELYRLGFSERVVDGILDLTKRDMESVGEYRAKVKSNRDAIRVKIEDLRHNSDIRRLKGVTEKDIARMVRYHEFYLELTNAHIKGRSPAMTDIVERLRELEENQRDVATCCDCPPENTANWQYAQTCVDAIAALSSRDREIERLTALLRSCPCPGGGWNGMPAGLEPTVGACQDHKTCGCVYGTALSTEQSTPQSFAEAKRERDDGWIK